ncbi:MAG: hypothetical protein JW738_10000, partial [Actinobacteria bacterium]|nr:hypothetical protein [Actinomycetota bacterium]
VEILGLKDDAMEAIDTIQDQGTLHIEDLSERVSEMGRKRISPMEIDPKFMEREQKLNQLRTRVGDRIRDLGTDTGTLPVPEIHAEYKNIWSEDVDYMISKIEKLLHEVDRETRDPIEHKEDLTVELSRLEKYAPIMRKIQPLADQVTEMSNMASIALVIERKYKAILHYLNEEIGKITDGESEVVSSDVDEESTAALIVFNRTYLKAVHDFLAVQDVNQVRLPSDLAKKPIDEAVNEVKARIAEIPGEIEKIEEQLKALTGKYSIKLVAARNAIQDKLGAMDAMPNFAQTDQIFIISGWLPEPSVEAMEKALNQQFGDRVMMSITDIREEEDSEDAPVMLKNNSFVRYFEAIYMLSKYPRYGTVDPTIIFAVFFPIFFGLMVGDIGYGLVLMALGWFAHRKWCDKPMVNMIGYILTVGGFWTIIFGVLYFELFGDLLEQAFHAWHIHLPLWTSGNGMFMFPINRLETFKFMMGASIAIGLIHMGIGLIFGIVNGIREKNRGHVMEKAGLLSALTGIVVALSTMAFRSLPGTLVIGIGVAMAIVGIIVATIGGKMGGFVESIVAVGNLFSYFRLAAIGLASAIMALVANDLSRKMWGNALGIIIAIFIAVLFHTLFIVIAAFSPSIHALRLHLVESFGKFFEPAKFRYEPFKKTGGEK